jgi:predicted phage-related endonuclease
LGLPENLDKWSTEALITALDLRTRFPKEHDAWESNKKDIEHHFQKDLFQKRTETTANIEAEFEQVRAEVEGFVVSELLRVFP